MSINKQQYDSIYENAQSLKQEALNLSEKESYGHSVSFLILSMEELIKYTVLMLAATIKSPLEGNKIEDIFRDHIAKRDLIREFFNSLTDESTSDFLLHYYKSGFNFFEAVKSSQNRFAVWGLAFRSFIGKWTLTTKEKQDFDKWILHINTLKQDGLYANLQDNGVITTPKKVNKKQYDRSLFYASAFFKCAEFMKSVDLTSEEVRRWQKNHHK